MGVGFEMVIWVLLGMLSSCKILHNAVMECSKNEFYSQVDQVCQPCPDYAPFSDGGDCRSCNYDSYFDEDSGDCISCPQDQFYDSAHRKCKCPLEKPFYNGTNCIVCDQYQIFDEHLSECQDCPEGSIFERSAMACRRCPDEKPVSNIIVCMGCPKGTFLNQQKRVCQSCHGNQVTIITKEGHKCVCPQQVPYFDGSNCKACRLPSYWNTTTLVCENCPKYTVYSFQVDKCTICPETAPIWKQYRCYPCPAGTQYCPQNRTCLQSCLSGYKSTECAGGQVYNSSAKKCQCPDDQPFYNGTACSSCTLPNYWDATQLQCQECSNGLHFNLTTESCTACPQKTVFNASTFQCSPCPKGFHFASGKCNKCLSTQFFNQTSQACDSCPPQTVYNSTANKCSPNCSFSQIYNQTSSSCVCPPEKPYLGDSTCVTCALPKFWDSVSKNCRSCPQQLIYDSSLHICKQCPKGTTYSNVSLKCENIQCAFPLYYDTQAKKCSLCQSGSFYNLTTKNCSACPRDQTLNMTSYKCQKVKCLAPLFWNQTIQKCQTCQQGTHFNTSTQNCTGCETGSKFDPDLQTCLPVAQCNSSSHWNGSACLVCNSPQYWSESDKACLQCPPKAYYDKNKSHCVSCPQGYQFELDIYKCVKTVKCTNNQIFNKATEQCECPSQLPHFQTKTQTCVQCQLPFSYWSASTKLCVKCEGAKHYDPIKQMCVLCPDGQIFNATTNKCHPKLSTTKCNSTSFVFNKETKMCQCPATEPYYTGVSCTACRPGPYQRWDADSHKCVKCSQGQHYDSQLKGCASCPTSQTYDQASNKCISHKTESIPVIPPLPLSPTQQPVTVTVACSDGQAYNPVTKRCQCLASTPYFTGSSCINCAGPTSHWNPLKRVCTTCQSNQFYNTVSQQCQYCPTGYKIDRSSLTYHCVKIEQIPTTCTGTDQYWDGNKCVSCSLPNFWNTAQKMCQRCPSGYNYDTARKHCIKCPDGFKFDYVLYTCKSSIQPVTPIIAPTPVNPIPVNPIPTTPTTIAGTSASCEGLTPFWDGTRCVSCYLPRFWNHEINQCQSCPPGTNYDITLKRCLACPSGQTFSTSQYKCVGSPSTIQTPQPECPQTSPFWDGHKCVPCYLPQYWDYQRNTCLQCPIGTNYDITIKKCRTCPSGQTFNFNKYQCL